ncbi:hypothetical protein [Anaerovorax odorimutans]|uniref:hypothetical protein n=1 Tax=Anaerovorax odorimutans TaxID=109327 RepID=UPI00040C3607|nr:hypothetical protein [Anaerovorax odorimutans]
MLKTTRMMGLGVLIVIALFLVAAYGIATGNFFFDNNGKGITLLIIIGLGIFSVISFSAAKKIDVTKNVQVTENKVKDVQKSHASGVKKGFVHP